MVTSNGRVLSIQSHVAYGYVGGKAAVFPLQSLGFDVDVVNTVNFSNHSGYGRFGGTRTTSDELSTIFSTMDQNGFLEHSRLLTGYIPGAEALSSVTALAQRLRDKNPDLIYLLDPVIGDSGKMYVAPDVVPIYRAALSCATITTPNWYEVEVLTDTPIKTLPALRQAIHKLHVEFGVKNVVVSSIPMPVGGWLWEAVPERSKPALPTGKGEEDQGFLLCLASSVDTHESADRNGQLEGSPSTVHVGCVPLLPGYFSGVGDLFSALVLAHYQTARDNGPEQGSASEREGRQSVLPADPTITSTTAAPPSTESVSPEVDTQTQLSTAVSLALSKTHSILSITHAHSLTFPPSEREATDSEADEAEPGRVVRRMKTRELRIIQGAGIIRGEEGRTSIEMKSWGGFWG